MADLQSIFPYCLLWRGIWAKQMHCFATEESISGIWWRYIPPVLQTVEICRHEIAGRVTLQNLIHHVGKYLEWVVLQLQNLWSVLSDGCINTSDGGDIIAVLFNLDHSDSQSEKTKAGAVNPALTNRWFTNWRSKMHVKHNLVNGRLTLTIKLISDYIIRLKGSLICGGKTGL